MVYKNYSPWVEIGPALGVTSFTKVYIVKTANIFLSESIKPTAAKFGM